VFPQVRTVKGSTREAQRELTKMLWERDEGKLGDGRQPLARYLSEEWLPAVSTVSKRGRPLAPTTRTRYRDAVRHVSRHIGTARLCDLRPAHVEKARDALLAGKLKPQTVSDILRVLSQGLSRAEARGLVGKNPAAPGLVHRPTGERARFTVIDPALGSKILAAVTGEDPWDAAAHLALGLGLRREEVLGLCWEDVHDAVHVRRTLTAAEGSIHFGAPKSAAGRRDLPRPAFVARALQRHRMAQAERLLSLGIRGRNSSSIAETASRGSRRRSRRDGDDSPRPEVSPGSRSTGCATGRRRCSWPPASRTRWPCGRWAMPTRASRPAIRTW
jgi:integrase